MAWQPDYVTTDELKTHLRIDLADTTDDDAIGIAITAASRAIDRSCGRQFGVYAAAGPRVYTGTGEFVEGYPAIQIDDLMTTSDLALTMDATGGSGTPTTVDPYQNYIQFWPWNAPDDGRPWTHIVFGPGSPVVPFGSLREMTLTAIYGWTAVPAVVKQACLIQASRFFVRRDSQYGVAGSPETGTELRLLDRLDPDVAVLLSSVRRHWGAV